MRFIDPDGMWPEWGEFFSGVGATVLGSLAAVSGVTAGAVTSPTVVGAAGGATLATFGVVTTGLGIAKISDSFRSKGKEMDIPSNAISGIAKGISKKLGDKTGKTGENIGDVIDLASGGVPKTFIEKLLTGVGTVQVVGNIMGEHSGTAKKAGMQQDNTKVSPAKPKLLPKPQEKPKSQPTIQSAN